MGELIKKSIIALILLFIVLYSSCSYSATVTLTWTAPTTRADGSPLLEDEIKGYTIYYDCGYTSGEWTVGRLTSYTSGYMVGNCSFRIKTFDTNNIYSEFSQSVGAIIRPDKPTNLREEN